MALTPEQHQNLMLLANLGMQKFGEMISESLEAVRPIPTPPTKTDTSKKVPPKK